LPISLSRPRSYQSLKDSRLARQRLANLNEAWNKPEQAAPCRVLLEAVAKSAVGRASQRGKTEHFGVMLVR